ncbi:MAG: hypothetical protein AAGF11_00390 [Myxococcota bacterium]
MEINKRDRSALKSYFVEYALPTEDNFSELIDGMINQKDDGIVKQPGSPLSLQASGDGSSNQKVLNLYEDFADTGPAWTLSLNPRSNPGDPTTARKGLSIGTSGGVSRLFVDHASGQVGIGTVEPQAALHVNGDIICNGKVTPGELEAWQEITLESDFEWKVQNDSAPEIYGTLAPPGCLKDSSGIVHLRGFIKQKSGSGSIAINKLICQLPSGCWPHYSLRLHPYTGGTSNCDIWIASNGWIVAGHRIQQVGFTLDGISFPASRSTTPLPLEPTIGT